jgi:putative FmdB family regulatory protein
MPAYPDRVAAYEYRCRECQNVFEVRRSIHQTAPTAVLCPAGHADTSRVFSAVAVSVGAGAGSAPVAAPAGGGCCGGGCCG